MRFLLFIFILGCATPERGIYVSSDAVLGEPEDSLQRFESLLEAKKLDTADYQGIVSVLKAEKDDGLWTQALLAVGPELKDYVKSHIEKEKVIDSNLDKTLPPIKTPILQAENEIQYARDNDSREGIAAGYIELVKAYRKTEKDSLEHANSAIWAARYQSLLMNYEIAKKFIGEARDILSKKSGHFREKTNLLSESYFVAANRIYVELGQIDKAVDELLVLKELPNLQDEWVDRVDWYLGIYHFMQQQYKVAETLWVNLLSRTKARGYREAIQYWLKVLYRKTGDSEQAVFFDRLLKEEHPLSFYVAVGDSDFSIPKTVFDESEIDMSFLKNKNLKTLHKKISLVLEAKIFHLARILVRKFHTEISRYYPLTQDNLYIYVYLSRLYFASADMNRSIGLTTEIAKDFPNVFTHFPKQIRFYFPRPYIGFYNHSVSEVSSSVALAVSRQESAFNPNAKSSANAHGLMQLIPATALRMHGRLGFDQMNIIPELYKPEVNIQLGKKYLKLLLERYSGNRAAAYAAFNAGEYVVDRWLANRPKYDPMLWIELIPFGQTRKYVKKVWRNEIIYQKLQENP